MRNYFPWVIGALLVSSTGAGAAPTIPGAVPGAARSAAVQSGKVCPPATRDRPDPSHLVAPCPGSAVGSHATLETRSGHGVAGWFTRFARLFAAVPWLP